MDPQSRNSILEGIKELNKNGATIVYTTHYMEEVEQLCNRIAILDKGKIIAIGTKEALKELTTMGEKITVEVEMLNETSISNLKNMENILDVKYTKIFSELPTLNDVFLELTGKQLRD